ncbi:MAG: DinB family protein [SAR202 cluster bacterium]|nr:DinB family protein [SAR202 cluster bacterium]
MDLNSMVVLTFEELDRDLRNAMEGLTKKELEWRPSDETNSIGFIFWHMNRAEDLWVNEFARKAPHVFVRDGWSKKWGIPGDQTGARYGKAELSAFVLPPMKEVWSYKEAVRAQSLAYVRDLKAGDYDVMPKTDNPRRHGYTVGRMWTHLFCEIGEHVGHIRYLRGLQRGLNK